MFNSLEVGNVVSSILSIKAYKMIKGDYQVAIYADPTYICGVCWKFEYAQKLCKFNSVNYIIFLTNCYMKRSKSICKSCHKSMLNESIQCKL